MDFSKIIAIVCIFSTVVVIGCVVFVYLRNKEFIVKGLDIYSALLLSFVVGNIFYILQHLTDDIDFAVAMIAAQTIFTLVTMVCFIYFFRLNTPGVSVFISKRMLVLYIVCFLILSSLLLVNPGQLFFEVSGSVPVKGGALQPEIKYNIPFLIFQICLYGAFLVNIVKLIAMAFKRVLLWKQAVFIFTSVFILIFANAIYILKITTFDYTNILASVSAILITYCVIKYGVMDTIPYVKNNMFTLLNDPFFIVSNDNKLEYLNPSAEKLLETRLAEVKGMQLDKVNRGFPVVVGEQYVEVELFTTPVVYLRLATTALTDNKNKVFGHFILAHNITEEKNAERKLQYLSAFDEDTGLMNRAAFERVIDRLCTNSSSALNGAYMFALSVSNANSFKGIANSDQLRKLWKSVAEYIISKSPPDFIISRFSESEFYSFSRDTSFNFDEFVGRFCKNPHVAFEIEGTTYNVNFVLGAFRCEDTNITTALAISNVSFALQTSLINKVNYIFYSEDIAKQHELHKRLLTSLHEIDYENDFYLEFQPIVDIKNKVVAGAEALLRWNHPKYGNLSPALFIPIFERMNEMEKLGLVIIEKACDALKAWETVIDKNFKLSINISKKQIENFNFISDMRRILAEKKVNPKLLDFEITETAASSDLKNVIMFSNFAKQIGASISLDDFGAGDTSIAYITQLGPDKIKLDISLSENSHIDPQRSIVIKSILDMCNRLKISVVVEHVEDKNALESLKNQGFSLIQGHIFSKSLPFQDFVEYYDAFEMEIEQRRL